MENLLEVSHSLDIHSSTWSSTWSQDRFELYDYECDQVTRVSFRTDDERNVVRQGNQCSFLSEGNPFLPEKTIPLLTLERRENSFLIHQEGPEYTQEYKLWMVVKFLKNLGSSKGHKLRVGDWIKIGRVKLHVKAICGLDNETPDQISKSSSWCIEKDFRTSIPVLLEATQEKDPCRICLFDDSPEDNPLISPCECSGSMRNVHLECLQSWIKNKVTIRESNKATSYCWTDLVCGFCREQLPTVVEMNGVQKELINIEYPNPPYLLFEDFRADRPKSIGIHVVTLGENEDLVIGRGQDMDIKLPDISVSREHSKLRYTSKGFYLDDYESKFGSLVLIQEPIWLKENEEITIEISRTLLTLSAKQPESCIACMGCDGKKEKVRPFNETGGFDNEEGGEVRSVSSVQATPSMRQSIEDEIDYE